MRRGRGADAVDNIYTVSPFHDHSPTYGREIESLDVDGDSGRTLVSRNLHDRATVRQECGNDQMIGTILTAGLQGSCHEERRKGLLGRWGRKRASARRRSHATGSENRGRSGRVNCVSLDTFEWRKAQDAAESRPRFPAVRGFHHGTECRRARGTMRTMIYE